MPLLYGFQVLFPIFRCRTWKRVRPGSGSVRALFLQGVRNHIPQFFVLFFDLQLHTDLFKRDDLTIFKHLTHSLAYLKENVIQLFHEFRRKGLHHILICVKRSIKVRKVQLRRQGWAGQHAYLALDLVLWLLARSFSQFSSSNFFRLAQSKMLITGVLGTYVGYVFVVFT